MHKIVWNDELDAALIQKRAEGKSFVQCQDETGFSAEILRRRAATLGLQTSRKRRVRSWPPGREEILRRLREEGMSWSEIGREIGLSAAVCARRAKNMGIETSSPNQWTPQMDMQLRSLRARGLTWRQIGQDMSMSEWSARGRGRILGLVKHKTESAAPFEKAA